MTEGQLGIAFELLADADLRRGHGEACTFMLDLGVDRQGRAGADEAAHLGFLDHGKEGHALEFGQTEDQPARALRHRFGEQHAGHDRIAREMPREHRMAVGRDIRLDDNGPCVEVEVDDPIDQLKSLKLHDG